jgi:hypothetical protein
MTGPTERPTADFDDLEWRLSASLHRAAHRADDQRLLGVLAIAAAAAGQRAERAPHPSSARTRASWIGPALVAAAAVVLTVLSFWLVPRVSNQPAVPAAPVPAAPWTATMTVELGDDVHGVAPSGSSLEVIPGSKVRLIAHPTPGYLDRGKTYLQRLNGSVWLTVGPHDTDAGGTVAYTVTVPSAGTRASYRVQIRGAAGHLDGYSPVVTLIGT